MKHRLLEGEDPAISEEWNVGHPMLFPLALAQGAQGAASFQFRLPVDDTNTVQIFYNTRQRKPGAAPKPLTMTYERLFDDPNVIVPGDNIANQDFIAWVSQGPISDRVNEHLTATDEGVILYHKLLLENAKKVERGEEPLGIIRDPAENEPWIVVPREQHPILSFRIDPTVEHKTFMSKDESELAVSGGA